MKICEAVRAAHLRGVIHRDLKPGNILIDERGEPQILDFGLSKLTTEDVTDESQWRAMTMTGQFIGSLAWASPEQVESAPDRIDVRTDVYSLGVILYQLITGRLPHEVTSNLRQTLDRIVHEAPQRFVVAGSTHAQVLADGSVLGTGVKPPGAFEVEYRSIALGQHRE